jgi:hypothetical protein
VHLSSVTHPARTEDAPVSKVLGGQVTDGQAGQHDVGAALNTLSGSYMSSTVEFNLQPNDSGQQKQPQLAVPLILFDTLSDSPDSAGKPTAPTHLSHLGCKQGDVLTMLSWAWEERYDVVMLQECWQGPQAAYPTHLGQLVIDDVPLGIHNGLVHGGVIQPDLHMVWGKV